MRFNLGALIAGLVLTCVPLGAAAHSDRHGGATADTRARVAYWNGVALESNAIDHTPVAAGENRVYGEQLGPPRSARALAIVQLAVFDALNAIAGRYPSYAGLAPAAADSSPDAAVAHAAHDTLVALYPSQRPRLDQLLANDIARLPLRRARFNGTDLGRRAAAAILELRADDGSQLPDPRIGIEYIPSDAPGIWRQDPVSRHPLALGAYWSQVKPFVIPSAARFDLPPPPALDSAEYTTAFYEVKHLGGDGRRTPTRRTAEQTVIGIWWAYDGTPKLGTPTRLFNQIADVIAQARTSDALELARLLALANVAMADSGLAIWKVKYDDQNWRPVTAIREADPGTGPTGLGDGNPDTHGDPSWSPLGAPNSNNVGAPNFTPPFPAYPSGHAGLGAAMFHTLRRFYGTNAIAFSFVSDEYNGVTRDNHGRVRPRIERSFSSLSQAEDECSVSRIYLGVHWRYDVVQGYQLGRRVADYVYTHGLVQP